MKFVAATMRFVCAMIFMNNIVSKDQIVHVPVFVLMMCVRIVRPLPIYAYLSAVQQNFISMLRSVSSGPPLVVTKIVLNLNKRFLAVTIDEMASGLNLSATPIACSGFTIVVGGGAPRVTPTSTGVVQNGTLWELRCSLTGSEAADLLGVSTITSSVIITVPTLRPCPTSHNITTIRNDMTGPQLSRATANLATGRIVLIFDEPLANNVADFSADFDVGSTTISLRNLSASVLPSNHSRFIFLISSNDLSRVAGAHRVMIRISRMKIADKAGNKNMLIFQEGTFIAQGECFCHSPLPFLPACALHPPHYGLQLAPVFLILFLRSDVLWIFSRLFGVCTLCSMCGTEGLRM